MDERILEQMLRRRSIYRFLADEVTPAQIETLLAAGRHAPSSRNSQPWEFIIVRKRESMEHLLMDRRQSLSPPYHIWPVESLTPEQEAGFGAVALPPLLIVLAANCEKLDEEGGLGLSVACAGQNILLAAEAIDLAAGWIYCWGDEAREQRAQQVLRLPQTVRPVCWLLIGVADPACLPPPRVLHYLSSNAHYEYWQGKPGQA